MDGPGHRIGLPVTHHDVPRGQATRFDVKVARNVAGRNAANFAWTVHSHDGVAGGRDRRIVLDGHGAVADSEPTEAERPCAQFLGAAAVDVASHVKPTAARNAERNVGLSDEEVLSIIEQAREKVASVAE